MRFHQPLDGILDSKSKIRILRFLCRKGGEWSGRRLAAELSMNPVTAHRALRELREATLLDFRKTGSSFSYSLRDSHTLVRGVLRPLFEGEALALDHLADLLREQIQKNLRTEVVSAAIYGSLARGEEQPTSDIDLFVLVRSAEAKRKTQEVFERSWQTLSAEFGNSLAVYVNLIGEARDKRRRRLPLLENILRDHRLIWGKPLEEMLHDQAA